MVFFLFISLSALAREMHFDLDVEQLDIKTTDQELPAFDVPPPSPFEASMGEAPSLNLPSTDMFSYEPPKALTPAQKNAMDIFSTTLNERDARSLSVSPGGGAALIDGEGIDYSNSKSLKDDYLMYSDGLD